MSFFVLLAVITSTIAFGIQSTIITICIGSILYIAFKTLKPIAISHMNKSRSQSRHGKLNAEINTLRKISQNNK